MNFRSFLIYESSKRLGTQTFKRFFSPTATADDATHRRADARERRDAQFERALPRYEQNPSRAMSTPFRKAAHKLKKIARNAIPASSWNIYRGDRVVVTAGRDRGESGVVSRVDRDKSLVFVTGLNLVKKHVRGQGERPGQIVSVEAGLHYSKVALADPVSGAPVRVARMFLDDGTKVRVSRGALASGSVIPMPGEASGRKAPRATGKGAADTPTKEVLRETRDASNSDFFRGMREQDRTPVGEE